MTVEVTDRPALPDNLVYVKLQRSQQDGIPGLQLCVPTKGTNTELNIKTTRSLVCTWHSSQRQSNNNNNDWFIQ